MVPVLELDDGTLIGEAMAICRYFEELYPDPPLMGTDAKDKAIVEMWEKCANEEGMLAASELFRNTHPSFVDRGLPGSAESIKQHPYLVEHAKARLGRFYRKFDAQLANKEFFAGKRYTIADATTLCARVKHGRFFNKQFAPLRAFAATLTPHKGIPWAHSNTCCAK